MKRAGVCDNILEECTPCGNLSRLSNGCYADKVPVPTAPSNLRPHQPFTSSSNLPQPKLYTPKWWMTFLVLSIVLAHVTVFEALVLYTVKYTCKLIFFILRNILVMFNNLCRCAYVSLINKKTVSPFFCNFKSITIPSYIFQIGYSSSR